MEDPCYVVFREHYRIRKQTVLDFDTGMSTSSVNKRERERDLRGMPQTYLATEVSFHGLLLFIFKSQKEMTLNNLVGLDDHAFSSYNVMTIVHDYHLLSL